MRRRDFIGPIGGAAALPMAALAQKAVSMRRVGILVGADPFRSLDGFKKGLAELGWAEGRNIRFGERRPDIDEQLPLYADQLVRLAPDAIYVQSSPHLQAILHATSNIPVVFANVSDPVGQGFVSSLARPGGNITGFAAPEFIVASKQLDLLKKLVPAIERVAFMYDPLQPAADGYWAVIESAGRLRHWKTITFVGCLRQRAMTAPFVLEGAMNGPIFFAYVKQCLVPTLKRSEIVLMDRLLYLDVTFDRESPH
jgi:putative ABC transport system substrate-binding protein